uniref:C2 domain-containing protein n=1 Tax=Leersia perrieri TaxID=77586 RepID=A0A0D9VAB6_9ORYZ
MNNSSARFVYELDHGGEEQEEEEEESQSSNLPCFLDIYVHEAIGIHNICIYAAQDVYAKFTLTSTPDDAPPLATRVARGGGGNPRFDERLPSLRVPRSRLATDSLKCEVWMRSCAKRLLDDQLLGFALVPLAAVAAGGDGAKLKGEFFSLSSTDLFHSPAGTIRLSLSLHSGHTGGDDWCSPPETSIASEVVILEPATATEMVDYGRIEFPDLNVVRENDDMAVQYLPFLHLGDARRRHEDSGDCEMADEEEEKPAASSDDDGSKNASTSTTTTAVSGGGDNSKTMSCRSPDTPTSNKSPAAAAAKEKMPVMDIDMEAEQSAMQRQIMEMYMKSMQQFTESLSKMKLPMELDGGGGDNGVVVQKEEKPEAEVKKDGGGARVFYGSRAFF